MREEHHNRDDPSIHSNESKLESALANSSSDSPQSEAQTLEGPVSEISDSFKILKERLGHYEIVGKLGSVGMGVVYKAYEY